MNLLLINRFLPLVFLTLVGILNAQDSSKDNPLPSWNNTATKQQIIDFVNTVTTEGSAGFVPPTNRIATFDNDGTLWCEQPMYVQLAFTIDRVKALGAEHPEWSTSEPFASVLRGDLQGVAAAGKQGLLKMLAATHAGMTTDEYEQVVKDWITTARHPKTGKLYTEMVYQPMLELLAYLRAHGFKTFIVSGGGAEFMRPWTERVYGIPSEQVIGSSLKLKFELQDDVPALRKLAEIELLDDKEGKPVGIQTHIGRRPIFAAGNSDGDLQMLQYTTIPRGPNDTTPRLGLIIHHTDAVREYQYDHDSPFGRLDEGLKEAKRRNWTVVDMKQDWSRIYPDADR